MMKQSAMIRMIGCIMMIITFAFLFAGSVLAQEGLIVTVTEGCKKELGTYCKDVTPGEGRLLACLYAYGDKLSNRCEFALYDASIQLERAINALSFMATECRNDLNAHCAAVEPGEGRLLDCLEKNKKKVSSRCMHALKDTGLKK